MQFTTVKAQSAQYIKNVTKVLLIEIVVEIKTGHYNKK